MRIFYIDINLSKKFGISIIIYYIKENINLKIRQYPKSKEIKLILFLGCFFLVPKQKY
jgi:hypothetical protein